jgi:hypothetical protein
MPDASWLQEPGPTALPPRSVGTCNCDWKTTLQCSRTRRKTLATRTSGLPTAPACPFPFLGQRRAAKPRAHAPRSARLYPRSASTQARNGSAGTQMPGPLGVPASPAREDGSAYLLQ